MRRKGFTAAADRILNEPETAGKTAQAPARRHDHRQDGTTRGWLGGCYTREGGQSESVVVVRLGRLRSGERQTVSSWRVVGEDDMWWSPMDFSRACRRLSRWLAGTRPSRQARHVTCRRPRTAPAGRLPERERPRHRLRQNPKVSCSHSAPIRTENILKREIRRTTSKEPAIARHSGHSTRDQRVADTAPRQLITQRSLVQIQPPQPHGPRKIDHFRGLRVSAD
jgi:hypothetical protein